MAINHAGTEQKAVEAAASPRRERLQAMARGLAEKARRLLPSDLQPLKDLALLLIVPALPLLAIVLLVLIVDLIAFALMALGLI